MAIRCEYCDSNFSSFNEARVHMLTIAHIREKRSHELSQIKQIEKLRQTSIVPKDLGELMKLLKIQTNEDIATLERASFFKVTSNTNAAIVQQMIQVLHDNIVDYRLNLLPATLRRSVLEAVERHKDHTPMDQT